MRWKLYRSICRYLLLFLLPAITIAQTPANRSGANEVPVSGTVKDKLGAPVPGVSVTVFGKSGRGSSTDEKGHFSIQAEAKSTLAFAPLKMPTTSSMPAPVSVSSIISFMQ